MVVLFLLAALLQGESPRNQSAASYAGEVGGSVTHQCFYSIIPANKYDRKYWCRIDGNGVCYTIISTTGYVSKAHVGRVSLEDIPQKGTFAVTMTQLKKSDTGTYRCGIGTTNRDLYVSLNLTVLAGRIPLVQGELRGSVTVLCPPGDTQGSKKRFWCKLGRTGCTLIADSDGYVGKSYQGRIFITAQESSGAFKILINDLRKEDSGLYRCGTGRLSGQDSPRMVALPVFGPRQVYGLLNGSVTVKCFYPPTSVNRHDRKYWCRESATGCMTVVSTSGYTAPDYTGRALLSNEELPGSFSVVITQMGWEDSGLYLCGVGNYGENGETKELDVHVYEGKLFPRFFPFISPTIIGVKESSVTFECRYDSLKNSSKYWCKWRKNGCARIIDNSGYVSPLYEGRVAMFDNPDNKTITIILNQLKDSDKGYYWCMTDEEKEQQSSTELEIIDGQPGLTGKKNVEAQVGSPVDLTCSYPCKYYSYQKYWCKWSGITCTPMPASDQKQPGPEVTCDTDNKTVILSFDSVTKSDQGWYWCGVKHNGLFGETMAVELRVTEGELQGRGRQGLSCLSGVPGLKQRPPLHGLLHVASHGASLHRGSSDAKALAPTERAGRVFIPFFLTDLVSVGSYRTNISMSDFESGKEYGASNNASHSPRNAALSPAMGRCPSKEDADLAYSTFLLTSNSIAQGDSRGDSAAPDVSPPNWEG
uniref:Ig-like domain-containing protein n=1 Tax=Accipiter nisus TaxID=211598 RepID=A0A8B9N0M2_9AVES